MDIVYQFSIRFRRSVAAEAQLGLHSIATMQLRSVMSLLGEETFMDSYLLLIGAAIVPVVLIIALDWVDS